jgi:hypothetical protein
MCETIQIVWPDENFAQFGGHVLEHLFQSGEEMARLSNKRYTVRVTIEIIELPTDRAIASVAGRATVAHVSNGGEE